MQVYSKTIGVLYWRSSYEISIPQPDIRLTKVNDVDITQPIDTLKALSYTKLAGEVVDTNGNLLSNYNGTLTATVFDKQIERQTLGNDGVTDSSGELIIMDFTTLGEVLFKGQASVVNGLFEFDFIVPRDIGIPVGNGKVSFYAQTDNPFRIKQEQILILQLEVLMKMHQKIILDLSLIYL